MFSRFRVAERYGRGCASGGYQLLGKLPEPMRHLQLERSVHEVASPELLCTGVVAEPREPIVSDLERRCVGEIDLAEAKLGLLRDDLAELGWHVPAATPVLQQP